MIGALFPERFGNQPGSRMPALFIEEGISDLGLIIGTDIQLMTFPPIVDGPSCFPESSLGLAPKQLTTWLLPALTYLCPTRAWI